MPVGVGVGAIVLGFLSRLWPIGWIVLMAVWLYRISVRAGNFDIVRSSISAITTDQRIQMLLIAYCFGGFLEGAAGFGIPVAICAALLVSLGFQPLRASVLALVGNVASGAYGAIGIPVSNGAEKGGVALAALSTDMVFVLQIFAILCPVVMVMLQDGLRGLRQTGVVALITGAVFGGGQSLMLLVLGSPELVDIIAPLLSLVVLALIMQFWSPSHVFRESGAPCPESVQELKQKRQTFIGIVRAWSPFIFLSVTILLWSTVLKPVFAPGGTLGFASFSFGMPGVHHAIQQMPPIVAAPKAVEAVYTWNILGRPARPFWWRPSLPS